MSSSRQQTERAQREARIARIEELGNYGYQAQSSFSHVWDLALSGKEEDRLQAEEISRQMLRDPRLGDLHKAGLHVLLALGPDNFVWHAQQAVDLYTNLYVVRPGGSYQGGTISPAAEASRVALLEQAQRVLNRATTDQSNLQKDYDAQMAAFRAANGGRNPTTEEIVRADIAAMPEAWHNAIEDMAENMAIILGPVPDAVEDEDDGRGDMNDEEVNSSPGDESPPPESAPPSPSHGALQGATTSGTSDDAHAPIAHSVVQQDTSFDTSSVQPSITHGALQEAAMFGTSYAQPSVAHSMTHQDTAFGASYVQSSATHGVLQEATMSGTSDVLSPELPAARLPLHQLHGDNTFPMTPQTSSPFMAHAGIYSPAVGGDEAGDDQDRSEAGDDQGRPEEHRAEGSGEAQGGHRGLDDDEDAEMTEE